MVDTTDSKSVAGNRVRVQVSLPVKGLKVFLDLFFCKKSQSLLQTVFGPYRQNPPSVFLKSTASFICSYSIM